MTCSEREELRRGSAQKAHGQQCQMSNGRQRRESLGTHIKGSTLSFPVRPLTTVSMILPFLCQCQLFPSHFDVGRWRQMGLRFLKPLDLDGDAYNNRHQFKVQGWKVHCSPVFRLAAARIGFGPAPPFASYSASPLYTLFRGFNLHPASLALQSSALSN